MKVDLDKAILTCSKHRQKICPECKKESDPDHMKKFSVFTTYPIWRRFKILAASYDMRHGELLEAMIDLYRRLEAEKPRPKRENIEPQEKCMICGRPNHKGKTCEEMET